MRQFQSRLAVIGCLVVALASSVIGPAAVSAASPVRFDVLMGDQCVDGFNAEDGSQHFTWKSASNAVKADTTVTRSESGNWQYCSPNANTFVAAGDQLSITYQDSVHELVIPELTLNQNRVKDLYKGRGPAGDYVKLICGIANGFEPCDQTWRLRVDSDGQWGYKPHWDVRGGQWMYLMWRSENNDQVQVETLSPYLDVTIGRSVVSGSTRQLTNATVVDRKGSTLDVRGTLTTSGSPLDGTFSGKLRNASGKPVNVRVGDVISSDIAADAQWVVLGIGAAVDAADNVVRGQCGEETRYEVGVYRNGEWIDADRWFTDGDGSFRSDPLDLQSGDQVVVGCAVQATGDWVHKWFTAP